MRIIVLHQYYKTPKDGGGIRSWYLCRALIEAGHDVEVVTAWNKHTNATVSIDGYKVHYLAVHYHNSLSLVQRIRSFLLFSFSAYRKVISLEKPDVLYAISTPLTIGMLAMLLKRKLGTPYFFEVGDLWPDVPMQMGYIRNRLLITFLKKIELAIYQSAKGIVAMSPAMVDYFQRIGYNNKTICVTNFADLSPDKPKIRPNESTGFFTVTYAGTLGKANRLSYLIGLAEEAQHREIKNFRCIIMGEGAEEPLLKQLVNDKHLTNVSFLSHAGKDEAIEVLSNASMVYLSFGSYERLWTGSPNKYFDALGLGKPVLCNFGGWISAEIEETYSGIVYDPARPEVFFNQHWDDVQKPAILLLMGQNGEKLASRKYSLDKQIPVWLSLFTS